MEEPDDGQLLLAFQGGDAGAFEALVGRHQGALLRHARVLLGTVGAAEDVVQDVFLKLVQKPPVLPREAPDDTGVAGAHLASWLHRVTRNACMDFMRAEARRSRREEEAAPREATTGGLDAVEARDTHAAVERSIEKLPQDQREVLLLRLLNHRSYREIAEITGKKVGTVGWLVSVGLKALATELEPVLAGVMGGGGAAVQVRASVSPGGSPGTDGRARGPRGEQR